MSKTFAERLKTAGDLQKQAIMALFPESTAEHLSVIGNEMMKMLAEMAAGCALGAIAADKGGEKSKEKSSAVKKVDIG